MAAAVSNHHPSSPTSTNPTSKTVLQRYQLGKLLGKGSFAKVFHAQSLNNNNNKSVAIKVYQKSKIHPSMESQIIREVDAMHRLKNHPNILKLHEVLATKSNIYLVMELAKGGDLSSKLGRRPDHRFPEPLARRYFQQLVSAIHCCHQRGVAHRDIKFQNILIDEQGNLKIGGFRLCAAQSTGDNNTKMMMLRTLCGNPSVFIAPEMVESKRKDGYEYDGAKADVWACGVILFVMITGYLPFDDSNLVLMFKEMNRREFFFPSWVTKPARGLITRLLDPNPNTRMGINEIILEGSWFKNLGSSFLPRYYSLEDRRTCEKLLSFRGTGIINANSSGDAGSSSSSARMNAFEIIMMSSGFDLGRLVGEDEMRKPKRFTTVCQSKEVVVEKVVETGEILGYDVVKCGACNCCVWLRIGWFVLSVTVSEVVVEMTVVEMKVVDSGGMGQEQEEAYWNELMNGLVGVGVMSWAHDVHDE